MKPLDKEQIQALADLLIATDDDTWSVADLAKEHFPGIDWDAQCIPIAADPRPLPPRAARTIDPKAFDEILEREYIKPVADAMLKAFRP